MAATVGFSACTFLGTWTSNVSTSRRAAGRRASVAVVGQSESGDPGEKSGSRLGSILKNKQRILQAQLSRLQSGQLEERLSSLEPYTTPYRLLDTIAQQLMQGKTTIVAEIARLSPSESLESFSNRCIQYVEWGQLHGTVSARHIMQRDRMLEEVRLTNIMEDQYSYGLISSCADALAVCTDEEKSPNGAADLAAACRAVNVPVLRKDWIIHPLQIAETREAGAAAITTVYSVLGKGAPAILQYAVSLGLDAVVEVVNLQELQQVEPLGAPLYGINLSVGIMLSLPGVRMDVAKGLVGEIPFGASSLVGVWSIGEAIELKSEGADAVYVRHEVLQGLSASEAKQLVPQTFLQNLRDAMTGDD